MNRLNVKNPQIFEHNIHELMERIYDFFEITREEELEKEINGCVVYVGQKLCFQVASQFHRDDEYLQCLLDMVRVSFDPRLMTTTFLNSNIGFLYPLIPEAPFQLGYLSVLSEEDESLSELWKRLIKVKMEEQNYSFEKSEGIFIVISTGLQRYNLDLIEEAGDCLGIGYTVEDMKSLFGIGDEQHAKNQVHVGFCNVPELGNRLRASIWMFIPDHKTH